MDYTVHGILQARILEWVDFPFSRGPSQPKDQIQVSHIAGRFFTSWVTREGQIFLRFTHVLACVTVSFFLYCCSVAQVCLTLQPNGLQHTRPLCPSPSPGACSNQCPLGWWCHPTISFSTVPFSPCRQSSPASGSLPMSQLFASGGQDIGALASILPMSIQGWFPLGLTGLSSLQCKGLSRAFSSSAIQKHQFKLYY